MPIDYFRHNLIELYRSRAIGDGTAVAFGSGAILLLFWFLTSSFLPLALAGFSIALGIFGLIQGLFDVVVYLADPDAGLLIVRRIVWRKVDEEFTLQLDEIERLEVEQREEDRWVSDGDRTRIAAIMPSGQRIPLIKEFSSPKLHQKARLLNEKLLALRNGRRSPDELY